MKLKISTTYSLFWVKIRYFCTPYFTDMEYREIVSVTGLTGLYQLLSTKSDGAIVRNVDDKATKFISARQHNVTPLESIEVYTIAENVRLHNVFQKMQEHEESIPLIDHKKASKVDISNYFKAIFPEFDEDRVYVSDMKKMLKWYELLKANDLLRFEVQNADDAAANSEEGTTEGNDKEGAAIAQAPVAEHAQEETEQPADTAVTGNTAGASTAEEKPAKKAAKKKKTEE